ncbi:LmbE family N-acetylglucosaminyl deacetylase [Salinibacter ruber]|uniref:PIG-L deacetylase family protein n=1 Tax=Salinibacter ruber TaxID=146919 RepID=UPI0021692C62|nr:PIG-L family deacetylase [Salinibacter ruber]MCS3665259.1 LmbE family N-acetylglucosaminyl deacetylase [Salinibacter ruber]
MSNLKLFSVLFSLLSVFLIPQPGTAQEPDTSGGIPSDVATRPDMPVEEWRDKTILVTGAHPDDDSYAYGTLSRLQQNGNEIHVLIMTTGNVGTKDPDMSRNRLSQIRREEELEALSALGIPEDHYINLGYTDGMLEFVDEKEIVQRLVRHIREIQPDVLFSFDPGFGYQVWHKTDHRAAAYLSADAARAAEWRLLFPGQINHEGLQAHRIEKYMLYGGPDEAQNVTVEIGGEHAERKVKAVSAHMSQFSSAWRDYRSELPPEEQKKYLKRIRERVFEDTEDGTPVERFHYYEGLPDGIGKRHDGY